MPKISKNLPKTSNQLKINPKYLKHHQSPQQMRHLNDKLSLKLSSIFQYLHPSTELLEVLKIASQKLSFYPLHVNES